MKKLSILLTCLLFVQVIHSQKTVDKFISKHLKEDHTKAMSFPGWLFKSTFNIAAKMSDDEEFKSYSKLAKYVKHIRVFLVEEHNNIPEASVQALIKTMIDEEGYDEYIRIRSEGTNVNLFAIEDGDTIKRLVFFIDESDDTFAMIRLKLKLPYSAFKELNYKLQKELKP